MTESLTQDETPVAARVLDLMERLERSLAGKVVPEPGVYPGLPWEQYHSWDAASNSRLVKIRRSPAHLKAYLDNPAADTVAQIIGRASHSAILEPDDFTTRYAPVSQCEALTKSGSPCSNSGILRTAKGWRCGVHGSPAEAIPGGPTVLPRADYEAAIQVRDAVLRHPSAKLLLTGEGDAELSLVWDCAETNLRCKARLDRTSPRILNGVVVDVKTTKNASRREFERSIFSLGYHIQGAHYLDGTQALGVAAPDYVIVAVEKEPPFAVAVYRLSEGALDAGQEQLRKLKTIYAECLRSGVWPAYGDDVQDVALPNWAWDQIAEEVA